MNLKILTIGIILTMICSTLTATAKINNNNTVNTEKEHYYSYDEFTDLLGQLQLEYSEIFSYSSLGKTWEGRHIWLVKISDNVSIDEDEPKVLYKGGIHGDEKQGYQAVIYSIKSFLENYTHVNVSDSFTERVRKVVNNTELFFMPMVNPDGCEAYTRENGRPNDCIFGKTLFRGVDLNRNSGYKWELMDKYPFKYRHHFPYLEKINVKYPFFDTASIRGEGGYRGPYPFSEPESKAIKQVVENHSIIISIDHHGAVAGGEILIGWGWTKTPRPDENISYYIAENMSKIAGYKIGRAYGIAPILGRIGDWEYAEYGIMSFSIELPKVRGDRPFLNILHENGNILPWKNTPLQQICETQFLVNLYLAERAMTIQQEESTNTDVYTYQNYASPNETTATISKYNDIPGFEFFLIIFFLIILIVVSIFIWMKKKKDG